MKDRSVTKPLTFIDISTWVKKSSDAGHVFTFHSKIQKQSASAFKTSVIFGPVREESPEIKPIFHTGHFHRGLGNIFQTINMRSDLARAHESLDSLDGIKFMHFYEGGLRELTFLSEILASRSDCVAVFNFFASEPWIALVNKQNPLSRVAIKILSNMLKSTEGRVAFTADTPKFAELYSKVFEDVKIGVYPLFSNLSSVLESGEKWNSRPVNFLFTPRTLAEKKLTVRCIEILQDVAPAKITIVIASRWTSRFKTKSLTKISNKNIKVQVVSGPSSEKRYEKLFRESKVVVLPYLDKHYVFGSSGKVLDARLGGCWVGAPAGTSASELIVRNGWGVTFERNATSAVEAIRSAGLAHPPIFGDDAPVVARAIEFFQNTIETLNPLAPFPEKVKGLRFLPFLIGLQGLRWAILHAIFVPGKRFLFGLVGIFKRGKSVGET